MLASFISLSCLLSICESRSDSLTSRKTGHETCSTTGRAETNGCIPGRPLWRPSDQRSISQRHFTHWENELLIRVALNVAALDIIINNSFFPTVRASINNTTVTWKWQQPRLICFECWCWAELRFCSHPGDFINKWIDMNNIFKYSLYWEMLATIQKRLFNTCIKNACRAVSKTQSWQRQITYQSVITDGAQTQSGVCVQ